MASSADAIIQNLLAGTGYGRTVEDNTQQNAQIQGLRAQTEQQQFSLGQAQQQQAQQQQYQTDVENYFKGGAKPEVLGSLILKYPQQADAFKQSKAVLDQPQIDSQKTQYGELLNAADNSRSDLATKKVQSIITAEKAAGHDTSDAEDLLGQLMSSDPASQKAALQQLKGFAQLHLAGLDPKYADDLVKLAKAPENFTSTGDGAIYDKRTGDIVRQAPDKPKWHWDDESGSWIQEPGSGAATGGGGQASGATGGSPGSTPNAPRRSMGWTPRARDGGDNSDAVVDSKLAAISKATGLDPDAPLTPEQAAKVIAAIPATEGGAGSIADRNNNPGNIKFGGFARSQGATKDPNSGYAVFPTREAGMRAAQRLGQGYYARGQRTIRDIIEGKPVGGSAAPAQATPGIVNMRPPKAKPGYQILRPDEVPAGLDPNTVYQRSPTGEVSPVGGQKQGQLKPWPATALASRASNITAIKNIEEPLALLAPGNKTKEAQAAQSAVGLGTGALGDYFTNWNDPGGTDFRARIGQIGGIIIKDTSGAAVSLSEDARLSKWVPKVTDSPATVRSKLMNLKRELALRNDAMDETYTEDQGFRPFSQHAAPAALSGFKVLSVRPK